MKRQPLAAQLLAQAKAHAAENYNNSFGTYTDAQWVKFIGGLRSWRAVKRALAALAEVRL